MYPCQRVSRLIILPACKCGEICDQDTTSIHGVSSSHVHIGLTICTIDISYHARLLVLDVEGSLPSHIGRLIMCLHTFHGAHECMSDQDTSSIHTVFSYHRHMELSIYAI